MKPELERILNALNEKYGKVQYSRVHKTEYVSIYKRDRKDVLWYLVKTMEKLGKDRDYFESPSTQDKIAEFFIPDLSAEGYSKSNAKGGRAVVKKELDSVLERVWPTPDLYSEPPPTPEVEPEPTQTEVKFVGRDVDPKLYEKDAASRPELDEEFAALIGLKKDE